MPLLVMFIGSMTSALVGLFTRFLSFKVALRFASYTTWITILSALLVSVYVCLSSLYGFVGAFISGGGGAGGGSGLSGFMVSMFFMGVGVFIPANAGAVISCVGSVWIATSIYKIQKHGIENYSK